MFSFKECKTYRAERWSWYYFK